MTSSELVEETRRISMNLSDAPRRNPLYGGNMYQPEHLEIGFERVGLNPWKLQILWLSGRRVLKSGSLGKGVESEPLDRGETLTEYYQTESDLTPDYVRDIVLKAWPVEGR